MESKFGDILDGQLINLVKANPVLYQRSHENYKDNATKENIWEQIALSLEKSGKLSTKSVYRT